MKVLLVSTGLGIGGAERQVVDLASAMADQGHVVRIAYLAGLVLLRPNHPQVRLEALAVEKNPLQVLSGLVRLVRLVRRFKPDVVHSHMVHANLFCRLARIFVRMPALISSAHSSNEGGMFRMFCYRLTDRLATLSTNVSDAAVLEYEHKCAVAPGKMIRVHNGVDCRRFAFNAVARDRLRMERAVGDRPLFLAVGRLTEAKDYPTLLSGFAIVRARHPAALLWVAGSGELSGMLKQFASDLGLMNSVSFLGVRDDIPALLCAADVVVQSSCWEGFGLAIAEAMATERVVISTNTGGLAEVIGGEGFLAQPRQPEDLAAQMIAALQMSKSEARAMGIRARQRVLELFSLDAALNRWMEIYQQARAGQLRQRSDFR
ncbi:glycosyltransferase [Stutzerimonas stutzeri B1SMN1]|uniref:glycosyltransferase n=1 Tax=Stutzerimonas stutzeri TaxID=316 RepID=UPI0003582754|nr:glycosyltransferase [Stutzerimonas stutzeri]EPL61293.1 glycosyltransferase [Stutzerimonas stutzeri B1SMN1]